MARDRARLMGNAVIVGLPDDCGDNTDVPAALVEFAMEPRSFAIVLETSPHPRPTGFAFNDYFEALSTSLTLTWMRDDGEMFAVWSLDEVFRAFPEALGDDRFED